MASRVAASVAARVAASVAARVASSVAACVAASWRARGGARGGVRGSARERMGAEVPNTSRKTRCERRNKWRRHKYHARLLKPRPSVHIVARRGKRLLRLIRERRRVKRLLHPLGVPRRKLGLMFGVIVERIQLLRHANPLPAAVPRHPTTRAVGSRGTAPAQA